MQTYEVQPGQTMDALIADLSTLAATDRAITLVVPDHADMLTQVENLSRLRQFATSQGLQLRAQVVNRVTLGLFRIMGLDAVEGPGAAAPTPLPPPAPTMEAIRITPPPSAPAPPLVTLPAIPVAPPTSD